MATFNVGDIVDINGDLATVRYAGPVSFSDGVWIGVELQYPKGKNNGEVQGVRYFDCPEKFGMFVRPHVPQLVEAAPQKVAPARKPSIAMSQPTPVRPGSVGPASRLSLKSPVKALSGQQPLGSSSNPTTPRTATPSAGINRTPSATSRSSTPARPGSMPPPPKPVPGRRQSTISGTSSTSTPSTRPPSATAGPRPTPGQNRLGGPSAGSSRTATPVSAVRRTSSAVASAPSVASTDSTTTTTSSRAPSSAKPSPPTRGASTTPQRPTRKEALMSESRDGGPSSPGSPGRGSAAEREVEGLKKKLEFIEKKRQEDRDKIPKLESKVEQLQIERDRFEGIIQKLSAKIQSQTDEVKELKKTLSTAESQLQEMEAAKVESEFLIEEATLDREMAEENAEVLRTELEALRIKAEELEIENELLKEENTELSSDINPEERSSKGWIQLEKQNERLKDALLRLREITSQTETELKETVESLEEENGQLSEFKTKYEAASEKVTQLERAVDDLRQQLDTALHAEEMLEELTDRNMMLNEQLEECKATIDELESLRELNDELEINHIETEKQMQEEIDYKDLVIAEQKKRIDALDHQNEEAEYTITRFRDLVMNLQSDLEDMRASQQISETEAEELSARSRSMMEINLKLQLSASKAQNKTIDLELQRMEAAEALEHLAIVQQFLPDAYAEEKESVMSLLRFKRIQFKAMLLHGFIKDRISGQQTLPHANQHDDSFMAACEMNDRLIWVTSMCERFVHCMNSCSVEQFSRFKGALSELDPVERALNSWIDALRRDELKEKVCATELQRTQALMSHLGELHLSPTLENYSYDLQMRTQMMQACMESSAAAITHTKAVIQKALPPDAVSSEECMAFYKKADAIISHSRSAKVVVSKILRSLTELSARGLSLSKETSQPFDECMEITQRLAGYSRALGEDVSNLVYEEGRAEPPTFNEIQSKMFACTERELRVVESELLGAMSKELRNLTNLLMDLGSTAADLELTAEFEKPMAPWAVRAQQLKTTKEVSVSTTEELRRMKEEVLNKATELKLSERKLEESSVKIELLESRMKTVSDLQKRNEELDKNLADSLRREKGFEEAIRDLQTELQAVESELVKAKKLAEKRAALAGAEALGPDGRAGNERAIATAREVEALQTEIKHLSNAVNYYRKLSHDTSLLPPPFSNAWLETPLVRTPPTPPTTPPPSLISESKSLLSELLVLITTSKPVDLSKLPGPGTGWRRTTETPRFKALEQTKKYEELLSWAGEVREKAEGRPRRKRRGGKKVEDGRVRIVGVDGEVGEGGEMWMPRGL